MFYDFKVNSKRYISWQWINPNYLQGKICWVYPLTEDLLILKTRGFQIELSLLRILKCPPMAVSNMRVLYRSSKVNASLPWFQVHQIHKNHSPAARPQRPERPWTATADSTAAATLHNPTNHKVNHPFSHTYTRHIDFGLTCKCV